MADEQEGALERLKRFYRHYALAKVATAELTLEAYSGREEAMFRALEIKYGPEADVTPLNVAAAMAPLTVPSSPFCLREGDAGWIEEANDMKYDDKSCPVRRVVKDNKDPWASHYENDTLLLPLHFDVTRNRLERIYAYYAPELLESVDLTLAAYDGRENVLFRLLQKKYGPEPSAFTPICPHVEADENVRQTAELRVELCGLNSLSSYDAVAALLKVGIPRDQVHATLMAYGPGREWYAASTVLLVALIGDALFDTDEKRRIVFPYNNLERLTGAIPSALDHLAFEHILAYRRVYLAFISGARHLRAEEVAMRDIMWSRFQAATGVVAYKDVILQEALRCLPVVETEKRVTIIEDETSSRTALGAWFGQQHHDLALTLLGGANRRMLRCAPYSTRVRSSGAKVTEQWCLAESWTKRVKSPPTTSERQIEQRPGRPHVWKHPAGKSVSPCSPWKPSGVSIPRHDKMQGHGGLRTYTDNKRTPCERTSQKSCRGHGHPVSSHTPSASNTNTAELFNRRAARFVPRGVFSSLPHSI